MKTEFWKLFVIVIGGSSIMTIIAIIILYFIFPLTTRKTLRRKVKENQKRQIK